MNVPVSDISLTLKTNRRFNCCSRKWLISSKYPETALKRKKQTLPIITLYMVYRPVCGVCNYMFHVKVYFLLCAVWTVHHRLCVFSCMVTESNDRMCVLNKPVIVWWACVGMSHSSGVETLLLPDEFPTGAAPPPSSLCSSPSTSAKQNIHSKEWNETEEKSSRDWHVKRRVKEDGLDKSVCEICKDRNLF